MEMIKQGLLGFVTGIVLLGLIVLIFRRQIDKEQKEKVLRRKGKRGDSESPK